MVPVHMPATKSRSTQSLVSGAAAGGFRLDRILTLRLFHLLPRIQPATHAIPILMYHSIGTEDHEGRHPYYATGTSSEVFAQQMRMLRELGYRSLTLDQVVKALSTPGRPEKTVAITFDDGFQDFATEAFPILQECGFTATMFLPTAYIGQRATSFQGKPCLTWSEVRELRQAGMVFGSHTATHPELKHMKRGEIEMEIRESRLAIEDQLGEAIRSFSYPFAFPGADMDFTRMLEEILESNGYTEGVTTTIGTAQPKDSKYFLKRLPVNSLDDPRLFQAKLERGYDWLGTIQHCVKVVKGKGTPLAPTRRSQGYGH